MTRFLLVRHAAVEMPENKIAGRAPDIHLTRTGREQAQQLVGALAREQIRAIYSSPRDRARETAQFIAEDRNLEVQIAAQLDELDYGEWTGASMDELSGLPRWQAFNSVRSCTRIPQGEHIVEVQARVVAFIGDLGSRFPETVSVLVSHADVIRAALAYYLAFPLDFMLRVQISPASVSVVSFDRRGPSILCVNHTGALQ